MPGRLLAEITRACPPHPVEITAEGAAVTLTCGNARFTLPTLPVEDYPSLPSMPPSAGTVDSDVFAEAVAQVAVAAGRDDTLPMLTGVRLEIEDETVTLAATDRYRLAVREFAWRPEQPGFSAVALVPARTLADAAKTLTSGAEIVAVAALGRQRRGHPRPVGGRTGRRPPGCSTPSSSSTGRSCRPSPPPTPWSETGLFTDAAKRVALVAERSTPLRCDSPRARSPCRRGTDDEGQAEELSTPRWRARTSTIGFNPTSCSTACRGAHRRARMEFTSPPSPRCSPESPRTTTGPGATAT